MPPSQAPSLHIRGILIHWVLLLTLTSAGRAASLTATLASATVPPGGTVQLQIFLDSPQTIVSGSAIITLDPTIFNNITFADVYSVTGDQIGSANIQGRTVDIEFNSQTGGTRRVPGLPILTVTVPILSTASPGSSTTPTFKPGTTGWTDTNGQQYSVTLSSGSITIGGQLSIGAVKANGATVTINGTGFAPSTNVQPEGIALATT